MKDNYFTVGQAVINAKKGGTNGAVGRVSEVTKASFRVEWLLSPEVVPYPEGKTSRFSLTAMAPKEIDTLEVVPAVSRGFAFIYPMTGISDIATMVEAYRADAEAQKLAVQTDFYMIGGVHGDMRYDSNERGTPKQPPCKKYLDGEECLADAKEMASKYDQTFVVLQVAAVVTPYSAEEPKKLAPSVELKTTEATKLLG